MQVMHIAAFALPFLLFGGIAVQAFNFYFFMLLVPFIYYWRKPLPPPFAQQLRKFAGGILLMWAVFPLSNILNYFLQTSPVPIPWSQLLRSHFGSVFTFTGVSLFIFSLKKASTLTDPPSITKHASRNLFPFFLRGLLIASVLECLYLILQQKWGINFLGQHFKAERILDSGLYRTPGFYSHPLTLAGVALSYLAFVCALAQRRVVNRRLEKNLLLVLTCYFVFASGGRFASLIAMTLLVLSFLIQLRRKKSSSDTRKFNFHKPWQVALSFAALVVLGLLSWNIGLLERFTKLTDGLEIERVLFWRVHWQIFLDHPLFGQGFALLNAFAREQYYHAMGFTMLEHKYPAHNFFLECLSNIGLMGSSLLSFGAYRAWQALKVLSGTQNLRPYRQAFLVAVVVNLVNGMTQNVFFDSSVIYIYFALAMLIIWNFCQEKT